MEQTMLWIYLIHLSNNMWDDAGSIRTEPYTLYSDHLIAEDMVWKKVINYLPSQGINAVLIDVGDGMEYESHPEISISGAWSKDKLKKELDYIRSLGMTPLPKLNFSTCHDAWLGKYERMVSTPEYYQVCKDIIQEVAEVFDYPKYFHLGMDEEGMVCQKNYSYCVIRQHDLWWHDAYYLFDCCDKVGARPWVWADYCWDHMEEYLHKMPKSVLQSNWWYDLIKKNVDGIYADIRYDAYRILDQAGFEQVPTASTWSKWYNNLQTMQLGRDSLSPERLKGYMTAPWYFTTQKDYYTLMSDATRFGDAKKMVYPEF